MLGHSFLAIFTNILESTWTSNILAIFNFHEKKIVERFSRLQLPFSLEIQGK